MLAVELTWSNVAVRVAVMAPLAGIVVGIVKWGVGSVTKRLDKQDDRQDKQDEKITTIQAGVVATNIAVARMEGYMAAAMNGGGAQLPDTPASTAIAEVAHDAGTPTNVVHVLTGEEG